jgi:two-component system response regulator YesN
MYKTLIVEDEVWMREGLKMVFQKYIADFQVSGLAKDGIMALEMLQNEPFDIVIMDIAMPRMDGIAMLEEMRLNHIQLPVVIITGHNEFEHARKALRYGVIDYLLKPLDKYELRDVLTNQIPHLNSIRASQKEGNLYHELDHVEKGKIRVETIVDFIENSYMEDISLSYLAEHAGFNTSYLSRLFKMKTGMGFIQYITQVRIDHAKDMLKQSELSIGEICKQVGFWDDKHFSRTFKRETGFSPTDFRKLH